MHKPKKYFLRHDNILTVERSSEDKLQKWFISFFVRAIHKYSKHTRKMIKNKTPFIVAYLEVFRKRLHFLPPKKKIRLLFRGVG